nr:MAG TPA: hypothetical protein [Caudoviricetes sp.]
MTVIEQQCMEAIISLNRKKKDENKPDWEQRRYEIAKAAMQGILGNPRLYEEASNFIACEYRPQMAANCARKCADALIAELKKRTTNQ